jgi:hypothetical protein
MGYRSWILMPSYPNLVIQCWANSSLSLAMKAA